MTGFSEGSVFREKAVARMYGVCAGELCGVHNCLNYEVTLNGWRWSYEIRFIRHSNVKRAAIRFGIYGHSRDSHLPARSNDANRNFTPIGDEDFFEHDSPLDPTVPTQ